MSKTPRDVSWIIQKLRQALFAGREYQTHLRFEGHNFAKRTQPLPQLPKGESHKLMQNNYLARDARRTHKPPEEIYVAPALKSPDAKPQLKA